MSCDITVVCACRECVALSNRLRSGEATEVDHRRCSDTAIAHKWRTSAFYWARLLELAVAHGWTPAGTEAYPGWWVEYQDEPQAWDGDYSYGVGQWITPADGRSLADAIDAGLATAAEDDVARVAAVAQWEAFLALPSPSPVWVPGTQQDRGVVVRLTKRDQDLVEAVAASRTAAFELAPSSRPLERTAPPLADLFGGDATTHARRLVTLLRAVDGDGMPPGAQIWTNHYVP